MPTPSFPGPPVVPISGGRATWNGRTVQECSDAIRWLSEATGGVLLMAQAGGGGSVPQEDFDALVAEVGVLTNRVTAAEAEVTHVHEDLDALENRVAALEAAAAPAP